MNKIEKPFIISGPCAVESLEQLMSSCCELASSGKVNALRGGIWKPRTRPNNFEGVGEIGLQWFSEVKKVTGLPIAIEVASAKHVEIASKYDVDILWIGARTTVSPFSVQELADALKGTNKTILIKNPVNPDVELWTGAVERFLNNDILNVGLVHRGFNLLDNGDLRNSPVWEIPLEMKRRFCDLPLICDPSHICGDREHLLEISQKAVDLNYDGLMIESHIDPAKALSDKAQQLTPSGLVELLDAISF